MTLEFLAMEFLTSEKRCEIILFERSPRAGSCGDPDVLGVNPRRFIYEIEVKRSLSDFRANARKPFHALRNAGMDASRYPKLYWFLTPPELSDRAKTILPSWAGLLRGPAQGEYGNLKTVVEAPVNAASKRLSTSECVRLVRCMRNQLRSYAEIIASRTAQNSKWLEQDFQI